MLQSSMSIRLKKYEKNRMRNKHYYSIIKTERKKMLSLINISSDKDAIDQSFKKFDRTLQKMKSKGFLHINKVGNILNKTAQKIRLKFNA